jgi:hypothetical protein
VTFRNPTKKSVEGREDIHVITYSTAALTNLWQPRFSIGPRWGCGLAELPLAKASKWSGIDWLFVNFFVIGVRSGNACGQHSTHFLSNCRSINARITRHASWIVAGLTWQRSPPLANDFIIHHLCLSAASPTGRPR